MIQSINSHSFNTGDFVRVVDPQESPSQWAKFRVISSSGALYQLVPVDRLFLYQNPLYVTASEIVSDF